MVGALLTAAAVIGLTPQQKAGLVIVSGLPAAPFAGGVIVRQWDREQPRPRPALAYADQEGGEVKTFPSIPPWQAASRFTSKREAYGAGSPPAAWRRASSTSRGWARSRSPRTSSCTSTGASASATLRPIAPRSRP